MPIHHSLIEGRTLFLQLGCFGLDFSLLQGKDYYEEEDFNDLFSYMYI